MSQKSEFSPLEHVALPLLGAVDCSGLIVIVGPNSSGKSQLLHDIHKRVTGQVRSLVVASDVVTRKLEYQPLVKWLEEQGLITTFHDDDGNAHWRPMSTYLGTGAAAPQVTTQQAQSWYSAYSQPTNTNQAQRKSEYLSYFAGFLVTALFLDRRLSAVNGVGLIDFVNGPPQSDLHALYMNDDARHHLFGELATSFGKAVWPDATSGQRLVLRVSDSAILPDAGERLSPKQMSNYRTIETEGDGLKSYIATCVALLLGRRPVCLLDEPELCLHPPQAFNLGRFIGRFGAAQQGTTFVATHSSHVLRGVIETASRLQIIRLTRHAGQFRAHHVSADTLKESVERPSVRAEAVLDGIFAQAVIVLEAEGDRAVYQAAWEKSSEETRLDIHFATVGGTGGIAETCALYRTLNIPVGVITDLDIVTDDAKLRRVLTALGFSAQPALVDRAAALTLELKTLPPTVTSDEARQSLFQLQAHGTDWVKGDDGPLRVALMSLAKDLDRMGRLKRGGTATLPDELRQRAERLLGDFAAGGLFVVPVGELEEWFSAGEVAVSKTRKWEWANEAATLIRSGPARSDGIWAFMRRVGAFLSNQFANG
jgi:hypothetical protein